MDEIDDQSIRLIITSPPYFNVKDYGVENQIGRKEHSYKEYLNSMVPVWIECFRILKPNGKLCINAPIMPMEKKIYSTHYNRDILNINNDIESTILNETDFFRFGTLIWDKGSTDQLMMGSYPYPPNFYVLNTTEYINIFVKDGRPEKISKDKKEKSRLSKEEWRRYIATIWRMAPERNRFHPAPFPVELPKRLIKMYSFQNDVIADPFMGSGTTAVAALYTDRQFVGYEINPGYIAFARKRLESINKNAILLNNDNLPAPDYQKLEMLRRVMKDEVFDEPKIIDGLRRGHTTDEILKRLLNRKKTSKSHKTG
ncbi:MAG: site-specific DNA-methyltransferase [Caldithrix sp.]|nr:site-specific DNA-methyltransferase [Caldithrix sp.]